MLVRTRAGAAYLARPMKRSRQKKRYCSRLTRVDGTALASNGPADAKDSGDSGPRFACRPGFAASEEGSVRAGHAQDERLQRHGYAQQLPQQQPGHPALVHQRHALQGVCEEGPGVVVRSTCQIGERGFACMHAHVHAPPACS